jgi:hypothetical protein
MPAQLKLRVLQEVLALCRLSPAEKVPTWALEHGGFISITRTTDELSIICEESMVPVGADNERGWRILKVEGPLAFTLTGILSSVVNPLVDAKVPVVAVGTYDTDYLLVRQQDISKATQALVAAGHRLIAD